MCEINNSIKFDSFLFYLLSKLKNECKKGVQGVAVVEEVHVEMILWLLQPLLPPLLLLSFIMCPLQLKKHKKKKSICQELKVNFLKKKK